MRILFAQLSDIHFKGENNPVLAKEEKLFHALQNKALSMDRVVLLITGDSAYSGNAGEFEIAFDFIERLKSRLAEYSGTQIDSIVIPGNHDCDFSSPNKLREAAISIIEKLGDEGIDDTIIDALTSTQKNYFNYADRLNPINELIETYKLLDVYKFNLGSKTIIINCFNSAYISQLKESPGHMYFPISYLSGKLLEEKADLVLSCFHHPLNWLMPENRREFKTLVEEISDMYFTGHEHQFAKASISDMESNITYYIEGDVLQDSYDINNSGFNTIIFDLDNSQFLIENFKWNKTLYESNIHTANWRSYDRNIKNIKNPFTLSKDFKLLINDVGFNIRHPNVSTIYLNDIYIYPRLDVIDYLEDSKNDVINITEDSESLIKSLKSNIKIIFTGPENIGKTSLLKMTYLNLHSRGFIPIIIDGNVIKSTNIEDFIPILYRNFSSQYNPISEDEFSQINKNKIVILIDDFNRIIVNKKYRNRLLSNLLSRFDNIIITNGETSIIQDLITEGILNEDLNFKVYQIKEFGHQLRGKLLNKWITIGVEETITDEERIYKLNKAESIIKVVTGKNLVPNYPLFILVLLQAIEAGNPTDLTASTFGHYYQYLIQRAFGNILKSQDEITSYNNYLSELAYYLFSKRSRDIDYNELKKFDLRYRENYTITHKLDTILENVTNAKIIAKFDSLYEFKYLYIYYYFVSNYLSDNIDSPEIKEIISAICKRIYKTDFANILLFLTHHTKDRFLLNEVLVNSKQLFSELKPCQLETGNAAIKSLAVKVPELVYKPKNVDEHRDELNEKQDEIDEVEKPSLSEELSQVPDIGEDISNLDEISKINLCFKTLEVLGQILKNNYGKIPNQMIYNLVEETYLLGLRSLNQYFVIIEENTEMFIQFIENVLEEKNITSPEKIKSLSKRILFNMCCHISYNYIKKVSDSVGTENLENAYKAVFDNYDYNSIKLIDFSIKLDHFKAFPNSEMKNLKNEFIKAPLALNLMQRMVINYLYLFPTTHEQRQRILTFLDIPINLQREVDFRSRPDKRL
ncbi:metallophosphoesterase [Spirosoma panaciterrae]|uniref:metallophosphoesterase n=1 Tax=Spirosoma panaciterrae TaxID=496058 RepID=UPI000374FCBD|nr:metallophosphoesterase [Spirosoma panaciterrae]